MAPSRAKVEEELSRCIIRLLHKEPFFGHLLAGVIRQVGTVTPTAGVGLIDARLVMMVNGAFFLETLRAREERVAVVKHETLHLLFKHVLRARGEDGRRNPKLWNLAADLVVNQHIGRPWRLPESAITLKTFPDLNLEPDRSADEYYARLAALWKEMKRKGLTGSGQAGGSGSGAERDHGEEEPGPGGSKEPDFDSLSAPESARALRDLASWHSDHAKWGESGDVLTDTAQAALDGLIARAAERVGTKEWGKLPGPLKAVVEAALARRRPQLDWRRVVRLFSNSSRRTQIVSTHRRPSRRYGAFPGIRVKRRSRLAVAVDTSGSISDGELGLFFSEIHGMWRQGAEVHVIECDAVVQRSYPYSGRVPQAVAGRGGTLFDPVFEYLRQDRTQVWDGCIYLTDGHAPSPGLRPPCKLLWVVCSQGRVGDHLRWGRVVQLSR